MDVLTFAREFLGRTHSPVQNEFLVRLFGTDPLAFWPKTHWKFALCWGMGGGKNMTMETAVAYTDFLLRCLRNPQEYFWGPTAKNRFIDVINFSFVNETQAKEVFFDSMKEVLRSARDPQTGGRWFEQQGVDLRDRGIGDIKEKVILLPGNVRNRCIVATKEGFEGSNILLGIFDEPSRAVSSVPKNADCHRLFEKVELNTHTRFGDMGKVVAFSYPEAQDGDLIMELVAEHGKGTPGVWASRHPTYEVNPLRTYEDFEELRRTNPELFATVIECNPPASLTGFYRAHPEKIAASFRPSLKPVVEWERYVVERPVPQPDGSTLVKKFTAIRLLKAIDDGQVRAIGGDAGEVGDSFAMAMGRTVTSDRSIDILLDVEETQTYTEPVTGQPILAVKDGRRVPLADTRTVQQRLSKKTVNRMPVIDLIIELQPISLWEKGQQPIVYPIDFVSVKEFILELKGHFRQLSRARFEKWQSVQMMQEFVRLGINAETVPFPNKTQVALYSQHRQLTYGEYIWHTPHPNAERQFRELQDINGTKVDHKPDGGKDLSDAIVLCTDALLGHAPRSSFSL